MSSNNYLVGDRYFIRKVTELSEFEKLRGEWDNLANKHGAFMPFLCFDWFKIWLDHFLKDDQLLVFLLYRGNELVTIAPCRMKEERSNGINVRRIDLIGNVYSPFRYLLFSELNEDDRIRSVCFIFESLFKSYKKWDICELAGIPEEKNCFDVLEIAIKQRNLKYTDFVCYADWYLDEIEFADDEYVNRLPEKIRKDISYCKRRLQKMGKYEFRLIRSDDEIDRYMDLYYGVYANSWQEKEGVGPTFHRDLAKMAVKRDWLRLGFLFFNGCPIASQFWISCSGTAYILKTVYDQDYKKYSPGKILTSEMANFVVDIDRVKSVDYVQGDEAYKQDWTPKRRERKGLVVFNNNIKGKYLELLTNKVRPTVNRNAYLRKAKEIIRSCIQ